MLDFSKYKNAERVFYYFTEISKIPRGSGNTAGIAKYLCDFAASLGLEYFTDSQNNVLIRKPAAGGYENHPTAILQGHTDMVAQKDADCDIDMEKEGLRLYCDGNFLKAEGTTLGADDGIAVAYMLAILEDKSLKHPKIEALFTSDEEIGLIGAAAFDKSKLSGKILINLDSGEEGIYTVGCAGGVRTDGHFTVKRAGAEGDAYKLTVSGLIGGHSGCEIDKRRGNAIKLGFELLSAVPGIRLISAEGGSADNAIPRDFSAEFISVGDVFSNLRKKAEEIKARYAKSDAGITVSIEKHANEAEALTEADTERIITAVCEYPDGIVKMSEDMEGLVETSLNVGIARLEEDTFKLCASVRSSINSEKERVVARLQTICHKYGAEFSTRGDYPGWAFTPKSPIRDIACSAYFDMTDKEASYYAIHAGLECGLFADEIENLDCISMGPDMYDIHTTEERLSISSAARFYDFLLEVLRRI